MKNKINLPGFNAEILNPSLTNYQVVTKVFAFKNKIVPSLKFGGTFNPGGFTAGGLKWEIDISCYDCIRCTSFFGPEICWKSTCCDITI